MDRGRLLGVFYLAIMPILFFSFAIWYWIIDQPLMILIIFALALIYVVFLSDKSVSYGSENLRKVHIPNAPPEVEKLLKTTSLRGELVFVSLLSVFDEEARLSQTDLVVLIKERDKIALTHQAIRPYIVDLENNHLIHSPRPLGRAHVKEYEYVLTEQGRWCVEAIRVCFPKTNFGYILRFLLRVKKLPRYPDVAPSNARPQQSATSDVAKDLKTPEANEKEKK